jgi:hypothetical protein
MTVDCCWESMESSVGTKPFLEGTVGLALVLSMNEVICGLTVSNQQSI